MKKILAIVIGIAFAFGTAGYVTAQAPATKTEDKKTDTMEKKTEKVEKKTTTKKSKKGGKSNAWTAYVGGKRKR